jgi:hypothetical protein
MNTQFHVSLTIESGITWDSEEEACTQIAAAIRYHLRKANVQVVGPVMVTKPHLRIIDGGRP